MWPFRKREEKRDWDSPGWNPVIPFTSGGPAHPSAVAVGMDAGLRLIPVYACVRVLADAVASLPLHVYVKDGNGRQRYNGPTLFDKPASTGTTYDWLHQCMTSLCLDGNAFGWVSSRDGLGFPATIDWLDPAQVWIDEKDTGGLPNPLRAQYLYRGREIPREDMLHVRAFSVAGRARGISPLKQFAVTIGAGAAMGEYAKAWFDAGGFPPGVFKNSTQVIDAEQSAEVKHQLTAAIRRREPLVLGSDWTYETVRVPPSEAQFVEALRLNATQVAAVYGVPAWKVGGSAGDSMTYKNIEQDQISFITDTLRPWLRRLELAFFDVLPARRYVAFNADALLKLDIKSKWETYAIQRTMGARSIDSILEQEDMEPLPGGVGAENVPLSMLDAYARAGAVAPRSMAGDLVALDVQAGAKADVPLPADSIPRPRIVGSGDAA
jgi:HK97 family phage portal protein